MKIRYNKAGSTHTIDLRAVKTEGAALILNHLGRVCYAQLTSAGSNAATDIKLINNSNTFTVAEHQRDIARMITTDGSQITLNGTAQADLVFEGDINTDEYSSDVTTITAAEGANYGKPIVINGNSNVHAIISNSTGNSIIPHCATTAIYQQGGADTFISLIDSISKSVTVNGYDANAAFQFIDDNGDTFDITLENISVVDNNLIFTADNQTWIVNNIFSDVSESNVRIVDKDGNLASNYSYRKSGAVSDNGSVTLLSAAIEYSAIADDTVSNYNSTINVSNLDIAGISTSDFVNNDIILGLDNGSVLLHSDNDSINLNGSTYRIIHNAFTNSSGSSVILTAGNPDGFTVNGAVSSTINASFTTRDITLCGGNANDLIIDGFGDNVILGGGGSNTLGYAGGHNLIVDCKSNDIVSLATENLLDLDNVTINKGNVTINSSFPNNSLALNGVVGISGIAIAVNESDIRTYYYTEYGIVNEDQTSTTLANNISEFDADDYLDVATVNAKNVTLPGAIIKANSTKPSRLISGGVSVTLVADSQSDSLVASSNTVAIVNFDTANDCISVPGSSIFDINAISANDNMLISFDNGTNVSLQGMTDKSSVIINGDRCTLDCDKGRIAFSSGKGFAYPTNPKAVIDYSLSDFSMTATIIANHGGTIDASKLTLGCYIGGRNASVKGGGGLDTFIYLGGNMTVNSYDTSKSEKIQLYYNSAYVENKPVTITSAGVYLPVNDGKSSNHILLEGMTSSSSVQVMSGSNAKTYFFNSDIGWFNKANPASATAVTLFSNYADFGIQNADNSEYYSSLFTITASQENSTIIGCRRSNTVYIQGGASNVITGLVGNDNYYFKCGGGVITDFGIGATISGAGTTLPTLASDTNYDRDDPTSYARGIDNLYVYGTVTRIAYAGFGNDRTSLTSSLDATIYYTADKDGKDYTIELPNIVKKPTKTGSSPIYERDNVAIFSSSSSFCVYDTSSGTLKKLSYTQRKALATGLD